MTPPISLVSLAFNGNFLMSTFPYNFDPNETLISCLTDFQSIIHITIYRANIVHQKEPIYGLSKE